MTATPHHWLILAPWYLWSEPDEPQAGRTTRPQLQMFASDEFIEGFLKEPQHSLKFDPDRDVVQNVEMSPAFASAAKIAGKLATLFPVADRKTGKPWPLSTTGSPPTTLLAPQMSPTATRKLFLPVHGRHYLVTMELRCDAAALPSVDPKGVCKVEFVVRRVSVQAPDAAAARALGELSRIRDRKAALVAELDSRLPVRASEAAARSKRWAKLVGTGTPEAARQAALAGLAEAKKALEDGAKRLGVVRAVDAWIPSGDDPEIGEWKALEPGQKERRYDMRRLTAPPDEPDHEAAGRAMYYGHVPTGSRERDSEGRPRFDDRSLYEIVCLVRRRRVDCTQRRGFAGCLGAVVESRPTEAFKLASPFDPIGAAQRPITIKMPDLAELAATAMKRKPRELANVRFVQPQHLSPKVKGKSLDGGSMEGATICHFSIPLITIVALFVLNLFLPIVVVIFQLWFLLAFRFCIKPTFALSGGLEAALEATPPSATLDAEVDIDVHVGLAFGVEETIKAELGTTNLENLATLQKLSPRALATMGANIQANLAFEPDAQVDASLELPATPSPGPPEKSGYLDDPLPKVPRPRTLRAEVTP